MPRPLAEARPAPPLPPERAETRRPQPQEYAGSQRAAGTREVLKGQFLRPNLRRAVGRVGRPSERRGT